MITEPLTQRHRVGKSRIVRQVCDVLLHVREALPRHHHATAVSQVAGVHAGDGHGPRHGELIVHDKAVPTRPVDVVVTSHRVVLGVESTG